MCWSGEASAALAAAGIGTTVYAAFKGEEKVLYLTLGYFSLMELLQAFTYSVIDKCALPANQIATLLGFLHITFQPFFINALALYFIPKVVARKVAPFVYAGCFVTAIMMLINLYPFPWAGQCIPGDNTMCLDKMCSVSGNWHIAWGVPYNTIANAGWLEFLSQLKVYRPLHFLLSTAHTNPFYVFMAFVVPFFYGSWRFTTYHLIVGPTLAALLTDNQNEWPAVWCLLSIGILLIVVKTPFRKYLHVKKVWGFKDKPGAK